MKIILFLIIFSLTSLNVLSDEKSMNSPLEDGFTTSKEETKTKNQTLTENKNIIPYIYAHTLIAPNSKIYFVQSDSVSTELVANDTDFINNNQLIKNYYFNDKTKNFEYYDSKKNKLYIRVDKNLSLDIKRQTSKLTIFNEKKKQIYSNLIREYISATKQFASKKDYISFVNENNFNFPIAEKVTFVNKDQEWFSEHNEVNSWHEPINLYSKYWNYYRSQPDINYGIENLGYVWLAEPLHYYPKTSDEIVDLYIGQRIIDPIEGIWQKGNYKIAIVKQDGDFKIYTIDTEYPNYAREKLLGSGILVGTLIKKDQESNYFGYELMFSVPSGYRHHAYFCGGPVNYFLNSSNKVTVTQNKKYTGCKKNEKLSLNRVWPKDLEAHNNKFKKSNTSIANNEVDERLNLNIIMQKKLYPQWRDSIFTKNLDNKLIVKPEIKKLTFNDCFFDNQYLKSYKQLLYLSNDGVSRTIEEIYEHNGVINIKENLFNYLKQYLKDEYDFKGELKRQCALNTRFYEEFRSLSSSPEPQYQILILPKGLKLNKIYAVSSSGQYKTYPFKSYFENKKFLGVVSQIDINKFNNAFASVNSKVQKSRDNKKKETQLIRSLAFKNDRNHVLMYTLKEPSYWKQTYCFINNSNRNKWDPALTAYIHHGYDNFHLDDFTKYINIVENDVKIKDKFDPNIIYNKSGDKFEFEYRWNSGDKGIIATKDIINELFLGIKSEKYNCTIIVGYPQDLIKIVDALKRDNFFKRKFLPLQGKLRKVSSLNEQYDLAVKIWKEYYENERKRKAMAAQKYQEKYGELFKKYPDCARVYYYIKNRMAQFSPKTWQYNYLHGLKRNIEGLVSNTSVDSPNNRGHCQNFLVMAYNTN